MMDPTASPFPGMDPYVEQHWRDVHHSLCTYTRDAIASQIAPALIARLEERIVLEAHAENFRQARYPDVHVHERDAYADVSGMTQGEGGVALDEPVVIVSDELRQAFVEIVDPASGKLVTVIEFLSPANKVGRGRVEYKQKQEELRGAGVSLVEIDLVRAGTPVHGIDEAFLRNGCESPYRIVVTKGWEAPHAFYLYPIRLARRLPRFRIPLREQDRPAVLDLQAVFELAYRNGTYWATVDYRRESLPALPAEEAAWADGLLRAAGKRA